VSHTGELTVQQIVEAVPMGGFFFLNSLLVDIPTFHSQRPQLLPTSQDKYVIPHQVKVNKIPHEQWQNRLVQK
jgi:hypothetical protein